MLHDLARGVQREDVDPGVVGVAGPGLMAVEHDEISLCDRTHELHSSSRMVPSHALEILDERVLAVTDVAVVLDVSLPHVPLDGCGRTALVEHQVVDAIAFLLFASSCSLVMRPPTLSLSPPFLYRTSRRPCQPTPSPGGK